MKLRRKKSKPVWIDAKTLRVICKKNRFLKSLKLNKDPDRFLRYKEMEKEAKKGYSKLQKEV